MRDTNRTKEDLRFIANRLEQYISGKWRNLSCLAIIFDTSGPRERPLNIILHGLDPQTAVRLLREQADLIEKAEAGDNLIVAPGPMIIPPSRC